MKKSLQYACHTVLMSALLGAGATAAAQAAPTQAPVASVPAAAAPEVKQEPVFARVGDTVITFAEYDTAFVNAARNKFYHGRAPEKDVAELQRTVADDLVNRILILREARRRGIQPDQAEIKKTLDGYEQRYGNSEHWKTNKDNFLPALTNRLEEDSIVALLEKSVRDIPDPDRAAVMAYYEANPDKFTEPERVRVSVVLLPVPPTAMQEDWDKAAESLSAVLKQIRDGADFAEAAKEHSKAPSAAEGGDMGYLHKGMLPVPVQDLLGTMKVGDVSEVVRLLEGVGLLKLTGRIDPKKHDFERVEQRARDLLKRDHANAAWKNLLAELRKASSAQIDESRFLPLAAEGTGDKAAPK